MLPSTGYFKGLNCPFYDGGLCERPYCHFRHVKRDSQSASDGVESGTILQKLVSAEVKKILQQTEASGSVTTIDSPAVTVDVSSTTNAVQSNSKVIYNPTPISELNKINNLDSDSNEDIEQKKRHIPVPYTPRKPIGMPLRRPVEINGSSKPFIYNPPPVKYMPGSTENVQCDTYSPIGAIESTEKYVPGSEKELQEYKPNETSENVSGRRNYIPSDKNDSKKKILEYKPVKVSTINKLPSVTYQPTPRSLAPCFSSDEDEPDLKKRKLSNDLNGLDDLGPEFDILDQILDEEKQEQDSESNIKPKTEKNKSSKIKKDSVKEIQGEIKLQNKSECKAQSDKKSNKTSIAEKGESSKDKKGKSHKIDKSNSKDKEQKEKSKSSDRKSSHKSSHKDRDKDKSKHKNKNDKDKHSAKSKSSQNSHEHSKRSSSKESKSSKNSSKNDHRKSHKKSKDSKDKHLNNKKNTSDLSDNENAASTCEIEDESYISESDEEAIALECKKIFEEYVPVEKPKFVEDAPQIEESHEEEYLPVKKRIARAVDKKVTRNPPVRREHKLSAAQVMADRLAKIKEFHNSKNVAIIPSNDSISQKLDSIKCPFNIPSSGNSKLRIAHVPYASTLVNAKKMIPSTQNVSKCEASTSSTTISTTIQTVKKGVQRVAHIPNEKFIDRPGVLEPLGSKIPPNIRSTYLNMMIDECLKLYVSATDAYARGQHEELATSKKCSTVQIYKNSAVLTVNRLRKELLECNGVKKSGFECSTLQRTSTGKTIESGSWSIENKNRKTIDNQEFAGAKLYKNIQKWILTEEQLQQNGFPRSHQSGEKGRAVIYGQVKQKPPKGLIRTCCRCKKEYSVDKKGFPPLNEECIYHPNKKYRMRGEVRYQCCSQDGTSDGCCIAPNHVYEFVDYDNLRGYVKTLPPNTSKDDYGVYSLDCEMCYTTHGLDLTRLTVINSACKVVYETFIKPLHPIIDYNTRFSGITEEQMAEVKTSLLEVQATLLTMFSSKTILIGHSLESDFKALKLIHDTVIDTSVLFPHKMGPPYKRALRNLTSEYLKKIIQNSVEGHNSAEDATVCMELIHYKLKEDLKTR